MRVIAVVNQKGGCGKTTVSINLASSLAEAGKRTLLIDMDSQSHCAVGLAVPEEQIEQSIYDVLISKSRNEPMRLQEILWQIGDRFELAPASIDLSAFEQQMAGIPNRECCLRDVLAEVNGDYDYAIIDCPPAVGLLTFNALRAATDVIVPVETGYFALHGLSKQLETLGILCQRCNQQVNVRVLASLYDIRTKMAREILGELRTHFEDKMFRTIVNFNTKIKEAASFGQPISEYDSASKGYEDFKALAAEVVESQSQRQRRDMVNSLAGQLEEISATADELVAAAKPQVIAEDRQQTERLNEEEAVAMLLNSSRDELLGETVDMEEIELTEVLEDEIELANEPEEPAEEAAPLEEVTEQAAEAVAEEKVFSPAMTEAKLSDYYGVSQLNDAVFFVTLYPHAGQVQIAGDFNNWQPATTPMEKVGDSGIWQTQLKLRPGKYRYRLVVDGKWQQDPYNELTEVNPFNEYNSVLEVK
jgi:chromosome partitioning protein